MQLWASDWESDSRPCKSSTAFYQLRWGLRRSEPLLQEGLAIFAEILPPCEFPCKSCFRLHEIHQEHVLNTLLEVKSSKSPGNDNISAKLIRDSVEIITHSLAVIFNKSLNAGIFPYDFKTVVVSPIYKAGDGSDCGNYQSISVIPVIAKFFEKTVCQQLSNYLESNDILTNKQTGCRVKQSTQTSMLGLQIPGIQTWIMDS